MVYSCGEEETVTTQLRPGLPQTIYVCTKTRWVMYRKKVTGEDEKHHAVHTTHTFAHARLFLHFTRAGGQWLLKMSARHMIDYYFTLPHLTATAAEYDVER